MNAQVVWIDGTHRRRPSLLNTSFGMLPALSMAIDFQGSLHRT